MTQTLEIVRFRVDPENAAAFVSERPKADAALVRFPGFLGSELSAGAEGSWTLIVRWASRADALAAQAVTLAAPGLPELAAWLALARDVTSFDTVDVAADSAQANLAVALRFVSQGLGKADMQIFDELIDADVVVTTGLSPQQPIRGREAYKQVFAGFADAWPVTEFVIEEAFAAGNKVVVRFTATAVFSKDYYGVKANNLVVPLKEVHVYSMRSGKIVESMVGALNLPFEFIMYPALKDAVLSGLGAAP